jgi:hypothetical protein
MRTGVGDCQPARGVRLLATTPRRAGRAGQSEVRKSLISGGIWIEAGHIVI